MSESPSPALLPEHLRRLAAAVPAAGTADLEARLEALHSLCYQDGWVASFDWAAWKQSPEAISLRDDRAALAAAAPEQLRKLLTTLMRQERFCEGTLAEAAASGLLAAIGARAGRLAAG